MRSIILSLAVSMAVTHQAVAFTYWIDGTCTGHRSMDDTVKETKYMASTAYKRLNSASDTDFQHVYEFAMKRKKDTNDKVFKDISDFMKDVSAMTLETNRNAANVRIYCDEQEKRWKERIDPKTGRNAGGWEDKDNWILYPTLIRPGCLHTRGGGVKTTLGEAFKTYMDGEPPEKQADVRSTISLCDQLFFLPNGDNKKSKLLSSLRPEVDIASRLVIDSLKSHVSKILLHELSHTMPYATVDHGAYNWSEYPYGRTVTELSAKELETHADVRAILGQLAIVADRGCTLHRKPREDAVQKEKDDYNLDMKNGKFHKYDNISKRSLQGRKARLARRYAST